MKEVWNFIKSLKILANPEELLLAIKSIAPDIVLIVLLVLIVLRFIGFKGTSKYGALTFILAVLIAIL